MHIENDSICLIELRVAERFRERYQLVKAGNLEARSLLLAEDVQGVAAWLYHRGPSGSNEAILALREQGIALGLVAYGEMAPPDKDWVYVSAKLHRAILGECNRHSATARGAQVANDLFIDLSRLGLYREAGITIRAAARTYRDLQSRREDIFSPHYSMALTNLALHELQRNIRAAEDHIIEALQIRSRLILRDFEKFGRQLAESLAVASRVARAASHDSLANHFDQVGVVIAHALMHRNPSFYQSLLERFEAAGQSLDESGLEWASRSRDIALSVELALGNYTELRKEQQ